MSGVMVLDAAIGAASAPLVWWAARLLCRRTPELVDRRVLIVLVILGAAAGVIVAAHAPNPLARSAYGLFAALVAAAAAVDFAEMRLPDVLTLPLIGAAVVVLPWLGSLQGWDHARPLLGVLIGGGWAMVVAVVADQSLGDVKLAAGIGGWLAWSSWTALAAGILAGQILVALVVGVRLVARRRAGLAATDTPLGPALAAGAVVALLVGTAG